ncbi:MAG: ribosome small subunit-dependent GTPase A, partial [Candidatus Aminicenantes bacterium]|nr:ribosome small subunit-dependent GTPase A [Candidatus Aminicenantes bacterium]
SGRFRHQALGPADYPAVGDWAAVRPVEGGPALIEALLPRRGAFTRKAAGEAVEAQVVAANVDTVFLISGLDGDFNVRRIERYLATAWSSGARPVIVLNKADLRPDLASAAAEAAGVAPGVPIVTVRALDEGGLEGLRPYLEPGRTVALLGSSGVGKSTMINRLLGEDRFRTAAMSDAGEGRGRHTTTARELVRLPDGALLIDTPGRRELGLWADDDGLDRTFDEIEALAARCRFPDCGHEREPGCAVRAAVESGALDAGRWRSYLKLRRELRFMELKKDEKARRQSEKAAGRDFAARIKEIKRNKPRYR